jgi:tetratricopeptide (TPR) repeat protein
MSSRSVEDRLAAARSEHRRPVSPPPGADRALGLARWLGADLRISDLGRVLVVERSFPQDPSAIARLATLPRASYLDTETTGLSTGVGTVVFLAACARLEGCRLVVRQYLLPDYPDERALLRAVVADASEAARMVTYNGRAFDVPLLTSRLTLHGLWPDLAALPSRHDDLLPTARRLWRRPLGGARLAQVEAGVLGLQRVSDCPSHEVPGRWFGYLRGGSPDLLADVLDHNAQDVLSLALLEAELVRLRTGGWRDAAVLDRRGMALELLRTGAEDEALALLELAVAENQAADEAATRRLAARLFVAAGHLDRAEAVWRQSTRRASVEAATAWIEVARIRERCRGDLEAALGAVMAASRVLDLAFALGRGGSVQEVGRARLQVGGRRRRLERRLAAEERRARRRQAKAWQATATSPGQPPVVARPQEGGKRATKPEPPCPRPPSTAMHSPPA